MSVIKPGFRGFAVVENYYDENGDLIDPYADYEYGYPGYDDPGEQDRAPSGAGGRIGGNNILGGGGRAAPPDHYGEAAAAEESQFARQMAQRQAEFAATQVLSREQLAQQQSMQAAQLALQREVAAQQLAFNTWQAELNYQTQRARPGYALPSYGTVS